MKSLALVLIVISAKALAQDIPKVNWYRGNTHTHTFNSDGNATPVVVVRWYKEHNYQFVFITDHEYITEVAPLNALFGATERFLVLPGQEITQWGADPARSSAHVNSLFTTQVIVPIGTPPCIRSSCGAVADATVPLAETFKTNISAVRAANGIAQINHPNARWSVKPEDLYAIPDFTLIEIWNGINVINNLGGTDDKGDTRPSAEGYWDILLSRGKIVWGVGSDDSHEFYNLADAGSRPGQAWIMVRAPELSSTAIQVALRSGNFYASTGVIITDINASRGEFALSLDPGPDPGGARFLTKFIGTNGAVLAEVAGTKPSYKLTGKEGYVRASIMDSNGKQAWTQPVFTDARRERQPR